MNEVILLEAGAGVIHVICSAVAAVFARNCAKFNAGNRTRSKIFATRGQNRIHCLSK